jgi:hypothetical protein
VGFELAGRGIEHATALFQIGGDGPQLQRTRFQLALAIILQLAAASSLALLALQRGGAVVELR